MKGYTDVLIILFKSIIIGGLVGVGVGAGAARMFHAPTTQGMGAFRTLGELNSCEGDPASHFSFGLGFFFNAWASSVAAGSFTQDVDHRIIPHWGAAALMVKNRNLAQTLHDPKNGYCLRHHRHAGGGVPQHHRFRRACRAAGHRDQGAGAGGQPAGEHRDAGDLLAGGDRRRAPFRLLGHHLRRPGAADHGQRRTGPGAGHSDRQRRGRVAGTRSPRS